MFSLQVSEFHSFLIPLMGRAQVFGMAWSPDGKLLATVSKDGKVRIYDPRKSTAPVQVCTSGLRLDITLKNVICLLFFCLMLLKAKILCE